MPPPGISIPATPGMGIPVGVVGTIPGMTMPTGPAVPGSSLGLALPLPLAGLGLGVPPSGLGLGGLPFLAGGLGVTG